MSYSIIRKFSRLTKIISFEPNNSNYRNLKKIEKKDKNFKCKKLALSNKNEKKFFYTPYFKKYALTQISGISKTGIKERLKKSLYVKNLFKKLTIKKETLKIDSVYYTTEIEYDNKIFQVTWKSNKGFVYDINNFKLLDDFNIYGQGWGLTNDG